MAGDYLDQSGRNTEGSIRDAAFQQMKLADDITAMSSMTPLKTLDAADLV